MRTLDSHNGGTGSDGGIGRNARIGLVARAAAPVFALVLLLLAPLATARVRVVTSTTSLASLVEAVGGDAVEVESLALPTQDPHFVDGRPSLVLTLNRADLLVYVGLGLEVGWLPPLITNARNERIQPGRPGHLDASTVAGPLLGVRTDADASMGDVHPGGNPHYLYDPRAGLRVARALADRLGRIDPKNAAGYAERLASLQRHLGAHVREWEEMMEPLRGTKVVGYHASLVYLARWLGLELVGDIEPLPGVSPTPRHLAQLIMKMRRESVPLVVMEPWYDAESARAVARHSGATLVRLPGDVGVQGIASYESLIDHLVHAIHQPLSTPARALPDAASGH